MKLPVETVIARWQQPLFRAAWSVVQSDADAQEAVQSTFIRYYQNSKDFESEEHLRRWLYTVVLNLARDLRRASFWKRHLPLHDFEQQYEITRLQDQNLFEAVNKLPEKYRMVVHLYYYENWQTREIAEILHKSESCIRKRLSRARKILKEKLMEDWNDEYES